MNPLNFLRWIFCDRRKGWRNVDRNKRLCLFSRRRAADSKLDEAIAEFSQTIIRARDRL